MYKTYFPDTYGGLEESVRHFCRGTARLGVHNEIFTLSRDPSPMVIQRPEAIVRRFRRLCTIASCDISLPSAIAGFKRLVERCSIVHYHIPWPFADFLHFAARVRKPSLVTYHSDIVRQRVLMELYRPLMMRFLDSVPAIAATSPNYASTSPVLRTFQDKLTVIPLCLDETAAARPSEDLLKQWEDRVGRGFFLFIGLLRYYKGLDFLIEAVKHTRLQTVIAGSGPEEGRLRKQAAGCDNVRFLGFVEDRDKYALLNLAGALVFPSHLRSEAFGMFLLEGAMTGKPLITADIGTGTTYVNIAGETGLVVPPEDPRALREAMEKLKNDGELIERMGAAARARYERHFTCDSVAGRYYELYERLVG